MKLATLVWLVRLREGDHYAVPVGSVGLVDGEGRSVGSAELQTRVFWVKWASGPSSGPIPEEHLDLLGEVAVEHEWGDCPNHPARGHAAPGPPVRPLGLAAAALAVEDMERGFKALWPSGQMPHGRQHVGWQEFACALDHLRDLFPDRDHEPYLP